MFEKAAKEYIRKKNAMTASINSEINKERQPRLEKRAESQRIRAKAKALSELREMLSALTQSGASESDIKTLRNKCVRLSNELADKAIAS